MAKKSSGGGVSSPMTQIFPTPTGTSVGDATTVMEGIFGTPAPAPGVIKCIITTGATGTPAPINTPMEDCVKVKVSSKR